ncbi:O-antigen ligase family protein [Cellulophaga tyrosinoxydans]|uniref:O-antigen ligase n=1 Tax=Cellulophaga tyrosinoxydans TaxID=504486 RepID=A0A1W1YQK3_9FLAO|nr:O-antigen ligase family protein [Cellulophaga tyrosinoxydans]SMC38433.1 O-antigen ligase [Cellulophaga tyrosinoxydans]
MYTQRFKNISETKFSGFVEILTIVSFGLFPILPNSIKGFPVVILVLNAVLSIFKNNHPENNYIFQKRCFYALIMTSIYICYLFSSFYTQNISDLSQKLETSLSLLLVPICFIFLNIKSKHIAYFKITFIATTIIFIVVFWSYLLFKTNNTSLYTISSDILRNEIDSIPLLALHPIYASLIFSISIFFLFSLRKKLRNYLLYSIVIILVLNIIALASKMAIISLFIIIVYFLFKRKQKFYFKILTIFLISTTIITAVLYVPNLRHRFNEVALSNTYEKVIIWNSTSIRKGIYDCSIILLKKQWIFGYGIGDVQDNLNSCYEDKSDVLYIGKYNSHNQYLSIWLGTGILGFFIFLFLLAYNFNLALRCNDLLFEIILIFFILNFLTENILQRQTGVILFSLLINLFGWSNFNQIKVINLKNIKGDINILSKRTRK